MEETDMETVSRKKMKPASRYKKWLEGWCGAGFVGRYIKRLAATLRGGFTPACINDTEIPLLYMFTPWIL